RVLFRSRRAWLRRVLVVGLAQVARLHRSALHRLRACERLDWNQWRSSNECQCKRAYPDANVPREGRGARKGLQTLWYQSLPDSALQCTYRDWQIENRRPLRSRCSTLVERKGQGDISICSGLRRLHGEGQLRGTTRAAKLPTLSRRGSQSPREGSSPFRRNRYVASLCLR